MFPYCLEKDVLKWKIRREKILNEIKLIDPDIACLQEVDFFKDFYENKFLSLGYDSIYTNEESKSHGNSSF